MGSLSQVIHLWDYFNVSLCVCQSISFFLFPIFPFLSCRLCEALAGVVVVGLRCRPERLSPHFSMAPAERATLRAAEGICSLKHSEA